MSKDPVSRVKEGGIGEKTYSWQSFNSGTEDDDGSGKAAKKLRTTFTKPVGKPIQLKGHLPKNGELTPAEVVMFSGCKDDQESADVADTVRRGRRMFNTSTALLNRLATFSRKLFFFSFSLLRIIYDIFPRTPTGWGTAGSAAHLRWGMRVKRKSVRLQRF